MFTFIPSEKTGLEIARDDALAVLNNLDPIEDKDDYEVTLTRIETLSNLISKEMPDKLNINTIVIVAANIFIALKIVDYESTNVVTTKVLPFLMKAC